MYWRTMAMPGRLRMVLDIANPGKLRAALLRPILRHRERRFPFRRTYALGGLHQALVEEFGQVTGGYFIEAGANDGLNQSNTAFLEKHQGWTGMLIEALPQRVRECATNRPAATVKHAALVPFGYEEPFVEIVFSDLMSHAPGLSCLASEEHLAAGRPHLSRKARGLSGTSFFAPARTLDSLLEEEGNPRVDLLSLDVEGAELSVLKGIDFQKSDIRTILVEVRDLAAIGGFLGGHGYVRKRQVSHHDHLFVRP
jgi:FkbM family methyltransferase